MGYPKATREYPVAASFPSGVAAGGTVMALGQVWSCAYRKSSPSILVMQSTQDRTAQNAPRCLGGT
jgi:hypothetical protein